MHYLEMYFSLLAFEDTPISCCQLRCKNDSVEVEAAFPVLYKNVLAWRIRKNNTV